MKISILATSTTTLTSKAGKPYQQLEVTFKNLTFNKVESKKLMPFGENKAAFEALANAKAGDVFEVDVVKNAQGYNDWPKVVQAAPGSAEALMPAAAPGAKTVPVKSTYETPEERAKKQVFIIKQSSLNNAIASLTPGAKSALSFDAVTALAEQYTNWVMGIGANKLNNSFSDVELADMANDLDVE